MSTPKKRSRSIARQLNAELVWRSFGKKLFWSVLIILFLLAAWCRMQETAADAPVVSREFTGSLHTTPLSQWDDVFEDLPGDFMTVVRHIADGSELSFSETFPFRGIAYRMGLAVSGGNGARVVSAEVILAVLWWGFLLFNLLSFLYAVLRSLSGSAVIRKYLRPIDDMTAWAATLSEERHSVESGDVRDSVKSDPASAGLAHDALDDALDDAIGEIDEVEDSGARIELHQTELEGLEDALNNMLKRLEEAKKKQIRFVDDASHELRTPIAVIHGYADMLDRWGKSDPKVLDEAVSAIKTESEHMTTLIDQLLFLARGEMDRHVLDRQPLDAQELLDEIMIESEMLDEGRHVFRMLSQPAEADPETDEAPKLMISADAALIKQAVRILRDNAVKYTPEGGEISFKAYGREDAAGRRICLEVSDTGIGIPSDELPRIFDRFYRGTNARADNAGGSGLGLSIAQWIVKEHGGKIEAISGSGFGTRMTIVVPEGE
ncbi:MAG: HAMP domain-containing histidine kinase [Clostridiales bacterium]|nr:HAMP domain-containing histidine kinase [Clostridiales bacterium]